MDHDASGQRVRLLSSACEDDGPLGPLQLAIDVRTPGGPRRPSPRGLGEEEHLGIAAHGQREYRRWRWPPDSVFTRALDCVVEPGTRSRARPAGAAGSTANRSTARARQHAGHAGFLQHHPDAAAGPRSADRGRTGGRGPRGPAQAEHERDGGRLARAVGSSIATNLAGRSPDRRRAAPRPRRSACARPAAPPPPRPSSRLSSPRIALRGLRHHTARPAAPEFDLTDGRPPRMNPGTRE